MRKLGVVVLGLVVMGFCALPVAHADSLQSVLFNVNGTQYTDYSAPGMNIGSWNQSTGNGTITFTFNPGPGSYFVDSFFDNQLNLPFFNEYGAASGSPATGQTWEIGDSYLSNIYADVLAGGGLPNTNGLPGTTDNFLNLCSGATCNGDAALAMGFSFVLGASEQAVITLAVSHTQPTSGFYLSQTHPIDANNVNASTLYFTGNVAIQPTGGGGGTQVPEPSTIVLVGTAVVSGIIRKLRR